MLPLSRATVVKLLGLEGDIRNQYPMEKHLTTGELMSKDKYETLRLSAVERHIDDAIQRLHSVYGTDLSAFFKNVQREAQAKSLSNSPDLPISKQPLRRKDKVRR
jgi:hypothetical protein